MIGTAAVLDSDQGERKSVRMCYHAHVWRASNARDRAPGGFIRAGAFSLLLDRVKLGGIREQPELKHQCLPFSMNCLCSSSGGQQ